MEPALAQERTPEPSSPGETGRTEEPAKPKSEADRLAGLERRVREQQRELDELRRQKEAEALVPRRVEEKPALPGAPATESGEDRTEIGFQDGFFIRGKLAGSNYEIRPRARIQLDYRAYPHAAVNDAFQQPVKQDGFLIRRARVGFGGTFNVFGFTLDVDPTRNIPTGIPLGDFWLQYQQFEEFRLRAGHYKCPWDLEDGQTSDLYLDFVERPMIIGSGNQLSPDFLPGAEVLGSISKGLFKYWLSVQNQADSNAFGTAGSPGNPPKSPSNPPPAQNISGDPLTSARLEVNFLGLSIGGGAIWANRSGVQNGFAMVTPGQYQWSAPFFIRGWDQRYTADVSYYQGPVFVKAVGAYCSQERWRVLDDHSNGTGLVTQGACLTLGWMFLGPPRDSKHPVKGPFDNWRLFDMDIEKKKDGRNVGAELLARFEVAEVDDTHGGRRGQTTAPALPSTKPDADVVRGNECKAMEFGLNVYPIENVRIMVDYVYLRIGDQTRSEKPHDRFANELLFRAQLEF